MRVEERALMNGIGEPYVDYMRRTKRLVPFVY
jgi:protein-S-isoprenylcysteine O-methyltransferase Ste14